MVKDVDSSMVSGAAKSFLAPGISLVLATYCGAERIQGILESIDNSTMPPQLLQVVIVPNGPDDGSDSIISEWASRTKVESVIGHRLEKGLGGARNAALDLANRQFLCIVDDDDTLETNYLLSLFLRASQSSIVLGGLIDVDTRGQVISADNKVNRIREQIRDTPTSLRQWPWVLSLNGAKLLPTYLARRCKYPEHLRSGEDVVFMAQLLKFDLELIASKGLTQSHYRRAIRPDSVSRQPRGYDFNVVQRLDVLEELTKVQLAVKRGDARRAITSLMLSQEKYVLRYLSENPTSQNLQAFTKERLRRPGYFQNYLVDLAHRLDINVNS